MTLTHFAFTMVMWMAAGSPDATVEPLPPRTVVAPDDGMSALMTRQFELLDDDFEDEGYPDDEQAMIQDVRLVAENDGQQNGAQDSGEALPMDDDVEFLENFDPVAQEGIAEEGGDEEALVQTVELDQVITVDRCTASYGSAMA